MTDPLIFQEPLWEESVAHLHFATVTCALSTIAVPSPPAACAWAQWSFSLQQPAPEWSQACAYDCMQVATPPALKQPALEEVAEYEQLSEAETRTDGSTAPDEEVDKWQARRRSL